jgi:hypothetical protein
MSALTRNLAAIALAAGCLLGTAGAATAAPAHHRAVTASPASVTSTVCSVNAASATIRSTPGGSVVGTMYLGWRFRVDDFRDNVWVYGAGYDPNGNLVAYGYILRQYLAC